MPFDRKGPWSRADRHRRRGNTFVAAPSQVQVVRRAKADQIPDVGERAPKVATDTVGLRRRATRSCSTRACRRATCTALVRRRGRQEAGRAAVRDPAAVPVARLRPGGRHRAAAQGASTATEVEFIHQEVYVDNDPNKGLRAPLEAFQPADRAVAVRGRRRREDHRAARGLVRPEGVRERASRPPSEAHAAVARRRRAGRPRRAGAAPATASAHGAASSSAPTCRSPSGCSPGARRPCSWSRSPRSPCCGRGRGWSTTPWRPLPGLGRVLGSRAVEIVVRRDRRGAARWSSIVAGYAGRTGRSTTSPRRSS